MHAFPIRDEASYERAVELMDELWDAAPGTPGAELREVMAQLIDAWEARTSTLPAADPRELIAFKLEELGWSQRELAKRLGWGSGRVSEVLSGKRDLTLNMVRELSTAMQIPAGLLVHDHARGDDGVWLFVPASTVQSLEPEAARQHTSVQRVALDLLHQAAAGRGHLAANAAVASPPRAVAHAEPVISVCYAGASPMWTAA